MKDDDVARSQGQGHVRWSKGGEGRIVSIAADSIVLRSTVPAPPGSRIDGLTATPSRFPLRVKIHACKRQPEGDFLLEGRPLDLKREQRERLELVARECRGP
jgi:hypothetical protein